MQKPFKPGMKPFHPEMLTAESPPEPTPDALTAVDQAVLEKFGGVKALPPDDPINPSHYRKHPSGIECIEITRHLNFNIGNAIKYLWRHMEKSDPVADLQKAQWYIDDEIRRLQGKR